MIWSIITLILWLSMIILPLILLNAQDEKQAKQAKIEKEFSRINKLVYEDNLEELCG